MGVRLVRYDAVRSTSWASPDPSGRNPDVVDQRQQLRVVTGLAGREPHRQRTTPPVNTEVGLGAPATAGPAQRVVDGLRPQDPVIRPSPLCGSCALRQRAGVPWPPWSRSRPPTPNRPPRARDLVVRPAPDPRFHPWPNGRNATRPFARKGNPSEGHATASRSENRQQIASTTGRRSLHRPPRRGVRSGSKGSIRAHISSVSNPARVMRTTLRPVTARTRQTRPSTGTSSSRRTRATSNAALSGRRGAP